VHQIFVFLIRDFKLWLLAYCFFPLTAQSFNSHTLKSLTQKQRFGATNMFSEDLEDSPFKLFLLKNGHKSSHQVDRNLKLVYSKKPTKI
jgi:hypothetical protein